MNSAVTLADVEVSAATGVAALFLRALRDHRIMTVEQLTRLRIASNNDSKKASFFASKNEEAQAVYTRRTLRKLKAAGYVEEIKMHAQGRARKCWYLTPRGQELSGGEPKRALKDVQAANQINNHTLLANEIGVMLAVEASKHDDEFESGSWRHEQHFYYRPGESTKAALIADAVLEYLAIDGDGIRLAHMFLEIDRGTDSVAHVAAKAVAYARLRDFRPTGRQAHSGWQDSFAEFPRVLFVFGPRDARDLRSERIRRRMMVVRSLAAKLLENYYEEKSQRFTLVFAHIDDLAEQGIFAPVWWPVRKANVEAQQRVCLLPVRKSKQ